MHKCEIGRKQPRLGFELVSSIPFLILITITFTTFAYYVIYCFISVTTIYTGYSSAYYHVFFDIFFLFFILMASFFAGIKRDSVS